eukprot:gnl/TRDRNA2_/TRDRNA2_146030_c0_seq2.p1 gnl/TRDRNA2_/TRDRNA2_146030_c0~~gnl/TRDRNA2_/TRDRNA2_146030_c0_seq2.p1  ORF type:complete len:127 (-),score=20.26 gnl/TRDRNA2_/TRDRNA2_146030_c0_seq2:547-927(-)
MINEVGLRWALVAENASFVLLPVACLMVAAVDADGNWAVLGQCRCEHGLVRIAGASVAFRHCPIEAFDLHSRLAIPFAPAVPATLAGGVRCGKLLRVVPLGHLELTREGPRDDLPVEDIALCAGAG